MDDIFSAYLGGPGGFSRDLVPSTSLGTAGGKIQYWLTYPTLEEGISPGKVG